MRTLKSKLLSLCNPKFFIEILLLALLGGKLYFSLFMLAFLATDLYALSGIIAAAALLIIGVILYLFFQLKITTQNLIIKFFGVILIGAFCIFLLALLIIYYLKLTFNFKVLYFISFNLTYSVLITVITLVVSRVKINIFSQKYKVFSLLWDTLSAIPLIIYACFAFFLVKSCNIPAIFAITFSGSLAYIILFNSKEESEQLQIVKLYNGKNIVPRIFYLFFQVIFDVNLALPFALLLRLSGKKFDCEMFSRIFDNFIEFHKTGVFDIKHVGSVGALVLITYFGLYLYAKNYDVKNS